MGARLGISRRDSAERDIGLLKLSILDVERVSGITASEPCTRVTVVLVLAFFSNRFALERALVLRAL